MGEGEGREGEGPRARTQEANSKDTARGESLVLMRMTAKQGGSVMLVPAQ